MTNRAVLGNVLLAFSVASIMFVIAPQFTVAADDSLPQVSLNADNLSPRSIEDLTRKVVARDYAWAWQTMAQALEQNRVDLLDGYFTGVAKQSISQLIADQKKTNVRVRYQDRGHKLEGLFYSPAGDAMQLRDHARLAVEVIDGQRVMHSEEVSLQYVVLMTPGADRWLVRDLEVAPEAKP
jgi:hypothetical protein